MARHIFPSEASRAVFNPGEGFDRAWRSAAGIQVEIYSDAGCTTLANIQTPQSVAILNSVVVVSQTSLMPNFLGPDSVYVLYARPVGGSQVSTIYAREHERLIALESTLSATGSFLSGSGAPSNGLGVDGDFYLDTTGHNLYGPKASGAWSAPVLIIGGQGPAGATGAQGSQGNLGAQGVAGAQGAQGAVGSSVRSGTGAPGSGVGSNGDFYLRLDTSQLYGPKASGSWPGSPVSLIGATGATGAAGFSILSGTAVPTSQGVNGDFYLKTDTNVLYGPKTGGSWGSPTSLVGPQGSTGAQGPSGAQGVQGAVGAQGVAGKTWQNGTGAPSSGTGSPGDYYFRNDTTQVYGPKVGSVWGSPISLIGPQGTTGSQGPQGDLGPQGVAGNTVRSGSGAPSGGTGVDGDFYYRTSTSQLYGPKTSGVWGSPVSLIGPQGATGAQGAQGTTGAQGAQGVTGAQGPGGKSVLSGTSAPLSGQGTDGDYFINTVTHIIYGPKASGAWPSGVTLVGPQGAQGVVGQQGVPGDPGPAGVQGSTGAQGATGVQGATGAQGAQGSQGTTGSQGSVGPAGVPADFLIQGLAGTYTARDRAGLVVSTSTSLKSVLDDVMIASKHIHFASGVFDLGSAFCVYDNIDNVVISGEGEGVTTIKNTNTNAAERSHPIGFTRSSGITIRDLTINSAQSGHGGKDQADVAGIFFGGCTDSLVERVTVADSPGAGFIIDASSYPSDPSRGVKLQNVTVSNVPRYGVQIWGGQNHSVLHSTFQNCGYYGVWLRKTDTAASNPDEIPVGCAVSFSNVRDCGRHGILLEGAPNNRVVANDVRNNGQSLADQAGIKISTFQTITSDDNMLVANYIIDDQGTQTQNYGLDIDPGSSRNTVHANLSVDHPILNIRDLGVDTRGLIEFSVRDYGAVGNGIVDDRAAIQKANDACAAAGGGIVWFPPGVYRVTSNTQLTIGDHVIWAAINPGTVTILQNNWANASFILCAGSMMTSVATVSSSPEINGNDLTVSSIASINDGDELLLRSTDAFGSEFSTQYRGELVTVKMTYSTSSVRTWTRFRDTYSTNPTLDRMVPRVGSGIIGITIKSTQYRANTNTDIITFRNCKDVVVRDCEFYDADGRAVVMDNVSGGIVTNTYIHDLTDGPNEGYPAVLGHGVALLNATTGVRVSSNLFRRVRSAVFAGGVANQYGVPRNNIISENTITEALDAGVDISSHASEIKVNDNQVSNCADFGVSYNGKNGMVSANGINACAGGVKLGSYSSIVAAVNNMIRDIRAQSASSASAWGSGTAYAVGDQATYNGAQYVCIVAHTNHVPPNYTYWDTVQVVDGGGGIGIICRGIVNTISDNTISSTAKAGILLGGTPVFNSIINNKIENAGIGATHTYGVEIEAGTASLLQVRIANNHFFNTGFTATMTHAFFNGTAATSGYIYGNRGLSLATAFLSDAGANTAYDNVLVDVSPGPSTGFEPGQQLAFVEKTSNFTLNTLNTWTDVTTMSLDVPLTSRPFEVVVVFIGYSTVQSQWDFRLVNGSNTPYARCYASVPQDLALNENTSTLRFYVTSGAARTFKLQTRIDTGAMTLFGGTQAFAGGVQVPFHMQAVLL